jgi:ATP-binding protein involved in chromosome partitioning
MSMELPFLGRVPLDIGIRTASDAGLPPAADDGDAIFAPLAQKIVDWLNPAKPASF